MQPSQCKKAEAAETRKVSSGLFLAFHCRRPDVSLKRYAVVVPRFMNRRPGHLISHEKLRVSVQLRSGWRSVVPTSHVRYVRSFITPFSNQEAPDAIRSSHFRNDHVLTIRHIGPDLKTARPISNRRLSWIRETHRLLQFDFVSRSFHRSSSVSHYRHGSAKRDLRQGYSTVSVSANTYRRL